MAEQARADRVPVVPVPGGFQPRAAVGYSLVAALESATSLRLRAVGAQRGREPRLRLAAELAREWGPEGAEDGDEPSSSRARSPGGFPVVRRRLHGVRRVPLEVPDQRERQDPPAFASQLPSSTTMRSWAGPGARARRLSAVFLEDPDALRPARARRFAITAELAAEGAAVVECVSARGETRIERLVSLVLLGDLVSLYLAVLRGSTPCARSRYSRSASRPHVREAIAARDWPLLGGSHARDRHLQPNRRFHRRRPGARRTRPAAA